MVNWRFIFDSDYDSRTLLNRFHEESRRLLPAYASDEITPALPSKEVTKVALRLKYQIEKVIPCELEHSVITNPNSTVITKKVIQTAREAGGEEYRACVLFCLTVCLRWFKVQSRVELWDSSLHKCRVLACEVIAKQIIASETDREYLMREALLKRYSIFHHGEESTPVNVIERAVDLHALRIIGSSGYQKCITYLWRGWYHQDEKDPSKFIEYRERANTNYWVHLSPDRIRTPAYQNTILVFFSLLYLALFTVVINTINPSGDLDFVEGILYIMTLAYICDELSKIWKVGRYYLGFWNVINLALYALLAVSFILRMIAVTRSDSDNAKRLKFNELSYNFLAFAAPMYWIRLLLFFDIFRFFGVMLVVLKVMMKESVIFFALLFFVLVGFLQAFVGMDQADLGIPVTEGIIRGMANTIVSDPDFDVFHTLAPPFGLILYYIYNFVIMVLLLNILIALYNTSYQIVSDNAVDEYMALFAQKTLQFVRAPDENVFIPPFNLIEIFFLIIPFGWWMPSNQYFRLNNYVMGIIYSPFLLITAWIEKRDAHHIRWNRRHGQGDDIIRQEWEQLAAEVDFDASEGWDQKVEETKPNVEVPTSVLEVRELKEQVRNLAAMLSDGWGKSTNKDILDGEGSAS